jgi:hypothetical protein
MEGEGSFLRIIGALGPEGVGKSSANIAPLSISSFTD